MPESVTFMMGKFPAVLPADRRYCRNHMWCLPTDDKRSRFGFTSYAVRLMQDVYFLDWQVNAADVLGPKQLIGHIETSKAMSDQKRYDRAVAMCRQASLLSPNLPDPYAEAMVYAELAKDTRVREAYLGRAAAEAT